ncbi:tropomyosin-2-like isoform X1 [Zingiber officinale]|uniref:tropomyosin-2-like isoform X1 n=2 Tax=Zingiber officinale TaxID=94328 RepID=UPI001C4DCD7A|nr:tropomyosin-2-like isoform X1 [Zingiber officinale]XP_042449391.1 tropomyosin-2-like isoform X1 [Zingiber officinale]XP_042449392.1 tropomyosin-2-like isoform X1 [Zingiber officinale]
MRIEEVERELRNCYQEIEYLQDQLNLQNVEANFMAEQVQSLELKLAGAEKLNDKLKIVSNELVQADSQCLRLMRELKNTKEELIKSDLQRENHEAVILDLQCEIESLKLEITALEQRYVEDERLGQQLAEEKTRTDECFVTLQIQLKEKQHVISCLEDENTALRERMILFHEHANQSPNDVKLDKYLSPSSGNVVPSIAKQTATSQDEIVKDEIEKMAKQIHESGLLVKQLKEELKEVKLKANEEAEDLTQEMAELRYQFTVMLEEESKRRAFVEEASIRRVEDLELQVQNEQERSATAMRRFQEVNELAKKQSTEISKLKRALEKLHLLPKPCQGNKPCFCGYCKIDPIVSGIETSNNVGDLDVICAKKVHHEISTEAEKISSGQY